MTGRKLKAFHDRSFRSEIRAHALFRALLALLILSVVSMPSSLDAADPGDAISALGVAGGYLLLAFGLLSLAYLHGGGPRLLAFGTLLDFVFTGSVLHAAPGLTDVVALAWMLNVAAVSLMVSMRVGMLLAVLSGLGLLQPSMLDGGVQNIERWLPYLLAYLIIALGSSRLGRLLHDSGKVAERQSAQILELSAMNEQILERLPVGVLVIDGEGVIRRANKVANELLKLSSAEGARVEVSSPALAQRLSDWRRQVASDSRVFALGGPGSSIEPQFLRLHPAVEDTLIFLEDTTQASRRAETMTLATLGRFSASLAHEIRNPLSAINYAAQLLGESANLDVMDRKMLEIIAQQVQRTNGIIQGVLGLARREKASPQAFDLARMIREFAEEYRAGFPLDADTLALRVPDSPLMAEADPRHVHQIVMVLVSNARYYGRMPEQPAHMTLRVGTEGTAVVVDVIDRGPGIPAASVDNLFRPFYTTSSHGTGLGLYIARELAMACRGDLEYLRRPSGACFRLRLLAASPSATSAG
ncbi:PAS domain-containing sensor histidine kinase [Lysobacter pythonis]|uniref:histidine kinase n=1 Tax=Solilutibacter pythonis TaxID=2483112 RepID=A0A3M2HWT4_9GAMM|nr:PAS domain-containing sensor histidine kinase [Lysobacter pythonis]RMH94181.1 PAS domain-containing sensor histidine kinase [Lysobacter pythonis]